MHLKFSSLMFEVVGQICIEYYTLAPIEVCGFSNKSQRTFCRRPIFPGRKTSSSSFFTCFVDIDYFYFGYHIRNIPIICL